MTRITFLQHNGEIQTIDAERDRSLMENALQNGVAGIDADCGGSCVCGTCRITVDAAWRDKVGGPTEIEEMIMEMATLPMEGARLSCQIVVTNELDGLIVTVPEAQFR
ncbi:MAG TPA: 2Fe-2S iron-sulfur cluster-binding protein [Sphingomonas sp.]|uniref:2Fe-2S iron-sulfur cluster-binding protein n=1 Tax=Sphingomonas sp. TaxID=28214 RepID=UPI002CF27CD7|nr:2Fe-2S iron-sulfur cluster-binding protein [Sphingomonas sp.]HMI17989.1 2Fe-2S iron-sulfur cluster-binding protein [Sphingomonas sp.]